MPHTLNPWVNEIEQKTIYYNRFNSFFTTR